MSKLPLNNPSVRSSGWRGHLATFFSIGALAVSATLWTGCENSGVAGSAQESGITRTKGALVDSTAPHTPRCPPDSPVVTPDPIPKDPVVSPDHPTCSDPVPDYSAVRCSNFSAPVCGCDGKTYVNECVAHVMGVNAQAQGECKGSGTPTVPADPGAPAGPYIK